MTSEQERYFQISNYLQGHLSEKEKHAFEKQIALSSGLAKEVDIHRETDAIIIDYNLLKIRNQLGQWQKENSSRSGSIKIILSIVILTLSLSGIIHYNYPPNEINLKKEIHEHLKVKDIKIPSSLILENKSIQYSATTTQPISPRYMETLENPTIPVKFRETIQPLSKVVRINPENSSQLINKKIENIVIISEIENCIDSIFAFHVMSKSSCSSGYSGQIIFQKKEIDSLFLTSFSIDGGLSFSQTSSFHFLDNGSYWLAAKTTSGCILKSIESTELRARKDCSSHVYILNLSQNDFWQPSDITEDMASIIIYSNTGTEVINAQIDNQWKWYGRDKNGHFLHMGNYLFKIKQGEKVTTGHISIIK